MGFAFITFYPAVMLAALFGGCRAGVLATLVSALLADYFWIEPPYSLAISNAADLTAIVIFVGFNLLASSVAGSLLETSDRLLQIEASQRAELERQVAERTAQLRKASGGLRESEERFRLLVEQAVDGIFLGDAAGCYVDVNSAGCKMLGYTRDELLSLTFADVLAPEEVSRLPLAAGKLAEGQVTCSEWRFRRKDRSEIIGEVVGRQLPDGRLLGILRDITGRKQAEEAIRDSQEQLRFALESAHIGAWHLNLLERTATRSLEHDRIFGYSALLPEWSYEMFLDHVLSEDRESVHEAFRRATDERNDWSFECRIRRADGEVRWIWAAGDHRFAADGTLQMAGIVQDITGRKQAEEALRESRERQAGLIQSAMDAIIAIDGGQRIVLFNPAAERMFGCPAAKALGSSIDRFIPAPVRQAHRDHVRRFGSTGVTSRHLGALSSVRGLRHNGEEFPIEASISQLDASGQKLFTVILRDITERKRHEKQAELLMREVNHRAKNMLAVVQSIARQTAATEPEDFIARFNDRIQALSKNQDLLVKNQWNGVDIAELVRSQLAHFEDLIGGRIEMKGPSLYISASAAQTLGMALHELSTNAGKYGALANADGRLEVGWSLECTGEAPETFEITWREYGGPSVTAPAKKGFGSTVITRMAMESLDAKVDLDFAAAGLSWHLRCPSKEVVEGDRFLPPPNEDGKPASSILPAA